MTFNRTTREVVYATLLFVLLAVLVFTLRDTNTYLEKGLHIDQDADVDRLRSEYQRITLGCNTEGALKSQDERLRYLCDVYLPKIEADLMEALSDG